MSDKIAAEVGTALHRLSHAIAAPVDSLLTGIEALKGERDEALAEVERLRGAVDDATHFYHQALEERDEALAAIERVKGWYGTVRYALMPYQQGEFAHALDGGDPR